MKTLSILLALLLFPSIAFAQLKFEQTEVETGISKIGMPINASFSFQNDGKEAFVSQSAELKSGKSFSSGKVEISIAGGGCECVTISGVNVEPGKQGTFAIEMRKLKRGKFTEKISIKSGSDTYVLTVTGTALHLARAR